MTSPTGGATLGADEFRQQEEQEARRKLTQDLNNKNKRQCTGVCEFLRQSAAIGVSGICGGIALVATAPAEAVPGPGTFVNGFATGAAGAACYVGTYEGLGAIGGVE